MYYLIYLFFIECVDNEVFLCNLYKFCYVNVVFASS